jgi:multiple sugar transport system permease protein
LNGTRQQPNVLHEQRTRFSLEPKDLAAYIALVFLGVIAFLPVVFMISTSLKTPDEVFEFPPSLLPDVAQWQNYVKLFENLPIPRYMYNTFVVSGAAVVFNVIFDSMAAFAFARLRFPGRNVLFVLLISSLIIPFQITMIPTFLIVKELGWIDTYAGLIAPTAGGAFGIILLRQFLISFPQSLEDSARIDGAGYTRMYVSIVMPLARPALATLAVLTFMFTWDDFLWPLIITNSDQMRTLQLGLQMLRGEHTMNWEILMAGSVTALIPVFLLFMAAQRFFIEGITLSGTRS